MAETARTEAADPARATHLTQVKWEGGHTDETEIRFLEGPQSRGFELARALRIPARLASLQCALPLCAVLQGKVLRQRALQPARRPGLIAQCQVGAERAAERKGLGGTLYVLQGSKYLAAQPFQLGLLRPHP